MTETKNAVITSAKIFAERGLLTCYVGLDYGSSGCQAFGGYALYLPKSFTHHELKGVAGHFIWRVMEVAGATDWASVPGKTVRVRGNFMEISAIGHIVKDDWFCPAEDFA